MGSKARLYVGKGHLGGESREGCAQRAGGISLDNKQSRQFSKFALERSSHRADVTVWIGLPWAEEPLQRKPGKAEFVWTQVWMLSGEDEHRRKPALRKRVGDRGKLDGFGPGADHQADTLGTQPSP